MQMLAPVFSYKGMGGGALEAPTLPVHVLAQVFGSLRPIDSAKPSLDPHSASEHNMLRGRGRNRITLGTRSRLRRATCSVRARAAYPPSVVTFIVPSILDVTLPAPLPC